MLTCTTTRCATRNTSAPVETRYLGLWMFPVDAPRDRAKLAAAVLRYYDECGGVPDTMTVNGRRLVERAFKPSTYRTVMTDPSVRAITLWSKQYKDGPEVRCDLRWHDPQDRKHDTLHVTLISKLSASTVPPPLRSFVAAATHLYPVAQGFIAGFPSLAHANLEGFVASYSKLDLDERSRERLHEDNLCMGMLSNKLRRLYPITIIGPEIWSRLPPVPKIEHAPVIEELGDCKMMTAWPDLVAPNDPAFLAGTVELRRWLWPFSIQNPADTVDPDSAGPRLG